MQIFQSSGVSFYIQFEDEMTISLALETTKNAAGWCGTPSVSSDRLGCPTLHQRRSVPNLPIQIEQGRCFASISRTRPSEITIKFFERLNADRKSAISPDAVPSKESSRARQIAIGFSNHQFQATRESQYQQYVAATPLATDVSVVEFAHPEQLFLLKEISGLVYCPASLRIIPHFFRERTHGFLYEARYDWAHTNDAERIPCNSWLAIVVIMDVPDAAWSRFEAQYPVDLFKGRDPVEFYDPDWRYQPAVKFSQNVFKSDRQCYSWPSGHLAIELCYMAGPGNEDLLQQFLQKYPSSAFRASDRVSGNNLGKTKIWHTTGMVRRRSAWRV
jgi:hypothetical protein